MARGKKTQAGRLADQGFGPAAGCTIRYGDKDTLPPSVVADDPAAAECWERTVKALIETNRWQPSDRNIIQRLAIAHSLCCSLEPELLAGKFIQVAKTGYQSLAAPLVAWTKASSEMSRLERALGITPTARADQQVTVSEEDELTVFLAEQAG